MHHHARRLVDHEQVLVLVDDLVGDPGAGLAGINDRGVGRLRLHPLARDHAMALRPLSPVHHHHAGVDESLGRRAGADLRVCGEHHVEPLPLVLEPGDQRDPGQAGAFLRGGPSIA